jgi:DNA (cytosine-5)-methyltransferase 1
VVDNFAGGGGASLGIEIAIGRSPHIAINHDKAAITMHSANHPDTLHYTDDVWHVKPKEACRGRKVKFLWASPDCRHFSRAKGNKPVKKNIRGLAWVVVKWAKEVQPDIIFLENVREFQDWGPVIHLHKDGQPKYDKHGEPRWVPDPTKKGETFKRWEGQLRRLGYKIEFQVLCAADYGVPTTRKRLFMVARRDGKAIHWPKQTHCKPDKHGKVPKGLFPWRTAAECIDWEEVSVSIFDPEARKAAGLKPILAEKTLRRIAMGIKRYVLENPKPFIVRCDHGGSHFRGQQLSKPLATIAGGHGFGLCSPTMISNYGEREGQEPRSRSLEEPMPTAVGCSKHSMIATFLKRFYGNSVGQPVDEPNPTEAGCGHTALTAAHLAKHYGGVVGTSVDVPVGTVTAVDHHSLVGTEMQAVNFVGTGGATYSAKPRPVDEPKSAVMPHDRSALVATSITKFRGDSQGVPITDPMPTVTSGAGAARPAGAAHALGLQGVSLVRIGQTGGNGHYVNAPTEPLTTVTSKQEHCLAGANLIKLYGTTNANDVEAPLDTVTGQGNKFGLAAATMIRNNHGEKQWNSVDEPLGAVTSQGNKFGVVYAFMVKYFGTAIGEPFDEPLHTATSKARFGIVQVTVSVVDGQPITEPAIALHVPGEGLCILTDITLRMLQPRELARSMSFPDDYKLTGSKSNQVAKIGNSVPPLLVAQIVAANLPKRRKPRKKKAA